MDTLRTLWIGALISVPLLAWGLSWLEDQLSRRVMLNVARGAVIVSLISVCGLFFETKEQDGQSLELAIMSWLSLPGFEVTLAVRFDRLALAQTALVSVVLLLVLSVWPQKVSLRWLMLAWFGAALAIVAGNLGQLFVGWTLSAWASSELARKSGGFDRTAFAFRPVWLVQRVSDMALLVGIGLIWMHFETSLKLGSWTPDVIGALRPELIECIALCVLFGVIGRCAQLPLTVWLETEQGFAAQAGNSMSKLSDVMVGVWNVPDGHHVADRIKADRSSYWHEPAEESVPSTVLAWWLCAGFLPVGIGLLARFEPLLAVASHTRMLMVAVGAFSMLMCSASAAAQMNWARVLSQFAVGQCGFVFVAMGIGSHSDGRLGVAAFLWQSVLIAVLLVATLVIRRQSTRLVVVVLSIVVAGLCGRHAVADGVWEHFRKLIDTPIPLSEESDPLVLGTTEARLWLLVVGAIFVSEFFAGFSLCRAWFLSRREPALRSEFGADRHARIVLWMASLLVLLGAFFSRGEIERTDAGFSWTPPQMFSSMPLLPLALVGAVLAWWMYSKPSSLPETVSAAMGPFARLSRNRFYWDDLYFLVVVHPATVIGGWVVWFDEHVWERGWRSLRNSMARLIGESAEPLSLGSTMIGALTTVGSAVVLAWMLLWLRS